MTEQIAEASPLCLWLLFKGVNEQRLKDRLGDEGGAVPHRGTDENNPPF